MHKIEQKKHMHIIDSCLKDLGNANNGFSKKKLASSQPNNRF